MSKIHRAIGELREMDALAAQDSPLHRLHPLTKLLLTISYILVTVSFSRYDLSGLIVMALYPVLLFQLGGISVGTCLYKLRLVLPLVCAVGLFNPIFDRTPLLQLGSVTVSGGVLSMLTLMLKGVFCLMASFLLAASTPIDSLCAALRKLHIPGMIVTLILLTYRYLSILMEEVAVMTEAYQLRAPGQRGVHISAWGSFLGQLLLRSMDRASELYSSMQLRGFTGDFPHAAEVPFRLRDGLLCAAVPAAFLLLRCFNVARLLGSAVL